MILRMGGWEDNGPPVGRNVAEKSWLSGYNVDFGLGPGWEEA